MGTRMIWQIHKHVIDKSLTQVKKCKWLVKTELTLGYKLALNSLHSHGLEFGGGHHPPLYSLFETSPWGLHWNDFFSW
jgi:hypothetical protein